MNEIIFSEQMLLFKLRIKILINDIDIKLRY